MKFQYVKMSEITTIPNFMRNFVFFSQIQASLLRLCCFRVGQIEFGIEDPAFCGFSPILTGDSYQSERDTEIRTNDVIKIFQISGSNVDLQLFGTSQIEITLAKIIIAVRNFN